MEASPVYQLLEGRAAFVREENGLRIFNIFFENDVEKSEQGYRVLRIGPPNHKPTRCVLLLGETGAGKTTIVNAALNYLYGVGFDDPFRLQARETKKTSESQTDCVTAYVINFKEGMHHDYNFVFLDTPGLADNRGIEHQKLARSRLEALLTSDDVSFDELHCVGLVAKSNTNRLTSFQKDVLDEIISLLGDSVREIICILATFAVDEPEVYKVITDAGIPYKSKFPFDNGVLYTLTQRRRTLPPRWDEMKEQYDEFFRALITAPSVSVRVLKENKLFDGCKVAVKEEIETLATLELTHEAGEEMYQKYRVRAAENEDWHLEEKVEAVEKKNVESYLYAHNCKECQKTCHICEAGIWSEMWDKIQDSFVPEKRTLGHWYATAFGGVLRAGASVIEGAGHGIGRPIGKATDLVFNLKKESMECTMEEGVCRECQHSLFKHNLEKHKLIKRKDTKTTTNYQKKAVYDKAVSKREEVEDKLKNLQQNMLNSRRNISHIIVKLLHHGKIIQELTPQNIDYIETVSRLFVNDKQHELDVSRHTLKLVNALKEVIEQLASCTAEEVLAKHELVEKMLSKT